MADGQVEASASENALANQPLKRSKTYGGTTGNAYNLFSGKYVSSITFIEGLIFKVQGIIIRFDNGTSATIGTTTNPKSELTVDLSHDSISRLFIGLATTGFGSGTGIGSIYIETIRGKSYSTLGGNTPLTAPNKWLPVLSATNDPLSNIVLVGIVGTAGTAIDSISFFYKSDRLMKHGITNVTYGQFNTSPAIPQNVASAIVSNQTGETQQMSVSFSKSTSSSYTFSTTAGVSAGLSTTVEAGVPLVANGEVEVSATVTFEVTLGVSKAFTDTFTYQAMVNVPPNETIRANAIASSYSIDADYTANFSEVWVHAGAVTRSFTGSVKGLTAYDVDVTYQTITHSS